MLQYHEPISFLCLTYYFLNSMQFYIKFLQVAYAIRQQRKCQGIPTKICTSLVVMFNQGLRTYKG